MSERDRRDDGEATETGTGASTGARSAARAAQRDPEPPAPKLSAAERARRRRRRRRLLFWLLLLAALVAAVLLIRCGGGFGLGGGKDLGRGAATSTPSQPTPPAPDAAPPARCQLRVDAAGIQLAGAPTDLDGAVAACAAGGADVVVTGDARQGTWDDLRAALDGAGVTYYVRGSQPTPADAGP